jgi:hypothetical protein
MSDSNKYLDLSGPEKAKAWLLGFKAKMRCKGQKDDVDNQTLQLTDHFLAMAGCDALERVGNLLAPKKLEETPFVDIENVLLRHMEPEERLTVSERSAFFSTVQSVGQTTADFVVSLRVAARHCKFHELKTCDDPMEELIKMRLVSGLHSFNMKIKLLEYVRDKPAASVREILGFIQNLEQSIQFAEPSKEFVSIQHVERATTRMGSRKCSFCGNSWHENLRSCPARNATCSSCNKKGHFSKKCRQKQPSQQNYCERQGKSLEHSYTSEVEDEDCLFVDCHFMSNVLVEIEMLSNKLSMQVDSGADRSVISSSMWKKLGSPKLKKYFGGSEAYDGHKMKVIGELEECYERDGIFKVARFLVIDSCKNFGLLGRDLIEECHHVEQTSDVLDSDYLKVIKNFKASIKLKPNAKDMFCVARPVPLPLVDQVDAELKRLEALGVISPCDTGVANSSPVVWVKKKNGGLRMCADFKVHVNDKIESETYPLPHQETIFSKLDGARYFAKIDLSNAYWQIELDDEAKVISVINTSGGLFTLNRLQMGMKNASSIFQKVIERCIQGLSGTIAYQDDILVFGSTEASLQKRLVAVQNKLQEQGFTVNRSKCVDMTDKISFLGFEISAQGIKPDMNLVRKILAIKSPANLKEVQHFVGMVNFFRRFLPDLSSVLQPLNDLKKKNTEFVWSTSCQHSFEEIKTLLSKQPLVQPYSLHKEVIITTDASENAIAGCLMQEGHPVIYVSRNLSSAERNYPNIERESLAVVWTLERLRHFLLGRRFTLLTDHQPLVRLLGANCQIPKVTSARIMNWAIRLMPYDYDIQHVSGVSIPHVDGMTRLNFEDVVIESGSFSQATDVVINSIGFEKRLVNLDDVRHEYLMSDFLQRLRKRVTEENWKNCSQLEQRYKRYADFLTVEEDVVYQGTRVVMPEKMRQYAIDLAHETHGGYQSTLRRLQLSAWWPGMAQDVEHFVTRCQVCSKIRPRLAKSTDKWPESPLFDRWHMDWCWIDGRNVFVIVEANSGWVEAFESPYRTSEMVIKFLQIVFCRFGIPRCLMSDNAPEFVSSDLLDWLQKQGIRKMESPPYNPTSNGLAERGVQIVKKAMKTFDKTKHDFNYWLQKILLHHRNTAYSRGKTPAELVFGRKLRLPVVTDYKMGEMVGYRSQPGISPAVPVTFLMNKGRNTSYVVNNADKMVVASTTQLAPMASDGPLDDDGHGKQVPWSDKDGDDRGKQVPLDRSMAVETTPVLRRSERVSIVPDRLSYG